MRSELPGGLSQSLTFATAGGVVDGGWFAFVRMLMTNCSLNKPHCTADYR